MQQFKGRVVVPGTCTAEALVSHGGFNTLASYQMAMMFGDKQVKCGDQNNPDIYKKPMIGKALCLPQTIGSTTGGMVLFTVCSHGKQPACMLFSLPIDSLAASGAILGDVWTDSKMPVVDSLGDEFLQYVQTGMTVTVGDDGLVTVEGYKLQSMGVILSYICPLMYMNNPLCKKKAVITNSNKLRTYTSARYYTDAEILDILTGKEGR